MADRILWQGAELQLTEYERVAWEEFWAAVARKVLQDVGTTQSEEPGEAGSSVQAGVG